LPQVLPIAAGIVAAIGITIVSSAVAGLGSAVAGLG